MRRTIFAEGEFYHVYNRGTEKRDVFSDEYDQARFLESMVEFNVIDPIGSLYEHAFRKKSQLGSPTSKDKGEKLVNIVAYCMNPNHYHLILQQMADKGVEKFMQRLGTGYTMYFNNKYERSGALFQGKFKAVHIDSNVQLLHVSAYVNLNDRVHRLGGRTSKSSWDEYMGQVKSNPFCAKDDILGQFRNPREYEEFAKNSLRGTLERRGTLTEEYLLEKD